MNTAAALGRPPLFQVFCASAETTAVQLPASKPKVTVASSIRWSPKVFAPVPAGVADLAEGRLDDVGAADGVVAQVGAG